VDTKSKEFLHALFDTPSPSGFEEPIQKVVRDYIAANADEVRTDVHGNVLASKNPDSPFKIMLAGHCDQIGFIINYIDADGFLYFLQLGGWDPQVVTGQRVVVYGRKGPVNGVIGKKPIHLLNEEERKHVMKIQDLWIDIGAPDRESAEELVEIGDCATVELACRELLDERITAVATDDKVGVWVVMEALSRIDPKKLSVGVCAVSTVQEEVGLRGAKTSAFGIDPTVGIAVDVTHATDCPTIDKKINGNVLLGGGAVLAKGPNLNTPLLNELRAIAAKHEIPVQMSAEGRPTGTDANVIQVNRSGVATALISIPNRYMHTPTEMISLKDLDAAADLIARYCESVTPESNYIPGM
jgi:putative aminopeptidase FrvX